MITYCHDGHSRQPTTQVHVDSMVALDPPDDGEGEAALKRLLLDADEEFSHSSARDDFLVKFAEMDDEEMEAHREVLRSREWELRLRAEELEELQEIYQTRAKRSFRRLRNFPEPAIGAFGCTTEEEFDELANAEQEAQDTVDRSTAASTTPTAVPLYTGDLDDVSEAGISLSLQSVTSARHPDRHGFVRRMRRRRAPEGEEEEE